jgi:hypothetical protein
MRRAAACAALVAVTAAFAPHAAGAAVPSVVDVNAAARAAGNRKDEAVKIGRSLLATRGPAQITKIRVDGIGPHQVAGIVLSGEKLREPVDAAGFVEQAIELIEAAFEAGDVEEVDVWATIPIPVAAGAVVSGDLAVPTSRIVFSTGARRIDRAVYAARIRAGTGVYWAPDWRAEMIAKARAARTPEPAPATAEPSRATPEPSRATPEPSRATPEPSRTTPEPSRTTPNQESVPKDAQTPRS